MDARKGFLILALTMLVFAAVCGGLPHTLFYTHYGRMPLGRHQDPFKVPMGASTNEVRATLGPPHDQHDKDDGTEVWHYHGDVFGLVIYGMEFDADGRLVNVWW